MRYRCGGCKRYISADEVVRTNGLQRFCLECSSSSSSSFNARSGNRTPVRKSSARPSRPKDDIPTKTRADLALRDGGRCRFCGSPNAEAHHINYRSEGVDHQIHNLILLCQEHHTLVHSNKRRWKPVLLAYVWLRMVQLRRPLTMTEVEQRLQS